MPDEIEMSMNDAMHRMAMALDQILNGEVKGSERRSGFVLMVFPFHTTDLRCSVVTNGASREDVIRLFKDQIVKFEQAKEQTMNDDNMDVANNMAKINHLCRELAAGNISREECKRLMIEDCNVADQNLDQLLDAYDPKTS